ncbi:hypothetical protein OsJ_22543 [Oryza sativa Japonica Group]|uniref:Uncharacterized protein n=1 Tax=Oryza sativa subsp. japonica TaxID=39947 RepID=A3BF53_ORYSJ|nr:hypothetical protein OsJ_22543 [Oryza sativa Japonica Group]
MNRVKFEEHIQMLGDLRHPNVLSPVGYHYRREEKLIVSEFMPRGSLLYVLHGDQRPDRVVLDWPARMRIAVGVGKRSFYTDTLRPKTKSNPHLFAGADEGRRAPPSAGANSSQSSSSTTAESTARDSSLHTVQVFRCFCARLSHGNKCKKRLLFDVSSRKIHGVTSTVFPDAFCEFENGGWLLMAQHKPLSFQDQIVFLVHPSTGTHLDLPVLRSPNEGFFVFYVGSHGMPLVVAFIEIMSAVPTAHIACPGDVYWSIYKHISDPEMSEAMYKVQSALIVDVVLLGKQAVCVDFHGQILSFSITDMIWRTVSSCPDWSKQDSHFLVASNEQVVAILHPCKTGSAFKFFKLDLQAMEWSLLDDRELDNTSWFLCKGQSYHVKEEGKRRVYLFGPNKCAGSIVNGTEVATFTGSLGPSTLKSITNIYAYDLVDETVETVIPASIVTEVHRWILPSTFAT